MVMMRSDGISRLGLVLALALTLAACSTGGPTPDASYSPVPAANAAEASLLPTDTKELPEATPESFDRLVDQLRGTPVVVNVWGSWCPPCREEMPRIVQAADTYGDRIQFVGIDIMDTREAARRFIDEFGVPFPSVFDEPGAIRNHLGYLGQPVTIFYDAQGNEVADWEGAIPQKELDAALRALLEGGGSSAAGV